MSRGHSSRQGERLVMNELEKFENDRENWLLERFTTDDAVVVNEFPDARTVSIIVGDQSFRLAGFKDTAKAAMVMRRNIAKALAKIQDNPYRLSVRPYRCDPAAKDRLEDNA